MCCFQQAKVKSDEPQQTLKYNIVHNYNIVSWMHCKPGTLDVSAPRSLQPKIQNLEKDNRERQEIYNDDFKNKETGG